MKKIMIYLLPMLLMTLGIVSCQKEELSGDVIRVRLERFQTKQGEKVTFDMENGFEWEADDQIKVCRQNNASGSTQYVTIYNKTGDNSENYATFTRASGTPFNSNNSTGRGIYYVYYPISISNTTTNTNVSQNNIIILPQEQTAASNGLMKGFPMYAEKDNINDVFKFTNLCGILRLHLSGNCSVSTIMLKTNSPIAGTFMMTPDSDGKNCISTTNVVSGTGKTSVTVVYPVAQSISGGRDFCIYLPVGQYTQMDIVIWDSENNVCHASYTATSDKPYIDIARSCYTSVTLNNLTFSAPEGKYFSVSAYKKVEFSPGNLQYVITGVNSNVYSGYYQFASIDYEYLGNANTSLTADNTIDLFGWGTGDEPTRHVNNSSTNYSAFVDWGNYPIRRYDNGNTTYTTDPAYTWSTLTQPEWNYLLNSRSASTVNQTANARYAKARVNGVQGMIIFPDKYIHPSTVAQPSGINATNSTGWNSNNYSADDWTEMKNAGAVFLPAAGYVNYSHSTYYDGNTDGYYVSASPNATNTAYSLQFYNTSVNTSRSAERYFGSSVRLVKDYTSSK